MTIGVVLGQVGTPEAPTPRAVRRYLAKFLSDRRVVDYPAWLWQPLLRGVILPLRSRRSAKLYQRIWTPAGSPLLVESEKQRARLQAALGDGYRVVLGMAYAGPSFDRAIDDLLAAGISTVVVLPMFPQYSSATTASVYDAVFAAATDRAGRARVLVPSLSCVPPYFDHPGYIAALCARIRAAIAVKAPDHVVLTFHGLPERYVTSGDPYREHCDRTVAALTRVMGWDRGTTRWRSSRDLGLKNGLARARPKSSKDCTREISAGHWSSRPASRRIALKPSMSSAMKVAMNSSRAAAPGRTMRFARA